MATVVRAEAKITAQNALRPGINAAIGDLRRFKAQSDALAKQRGLEDRMAGIGRAVTGAIGGFVAYRGMDAVRRSVRDYAQVERSMTRVAITGDATRAEQDAALISVRKLAYENATSTDKVVDGLNATVAAGRSLRESMDFLPAIVRTGVAANAEFSDIAKTAVSIQSNLKIGAEGMQAAFDALVAAGKAGEFEGKDIARYMPSHMPLASLLGFKGQDGAEDYLAMMQTIRKGTGTSEEAANAATNIFSKFESEKTIKGLAEQLSGLGMTTEKIEKRFEDARKQGKNLVWTLVDLVKQATKGDYSKIGKIVDDQQFKTGLVALLQFEDEYKKFRTTIKNSAGSVATDHARVMKDTQSSLDRFSEASGRAGQAFGGLVAELGSPVIEASASHLNALAENLEKIQKAVKEDGLVGTMVKTQKENYQRFIEGQKKEDEERQKQKDDKTIEAIPGRAGAARADLDKQIAAEESDLASAKSRGARAGREGRVKIAQERLQKLKDRRTALDSTLTPEEAAALSRDLARRAGMPEPDYVRLDVENLVEGAERREAAERWRQNQGEAKPKPKPVKGMPLPTPRPKDLGFNAGLTVQDLDPAQKGEAQHTADGADRRAAADRWRRNQGVPEPTPLAYPVPPSRPSSLGGGGSMVQDFVTAEQKVEAVKGAVEGIGPAAQSATSTMAQSFTSTADQMISDIDRVQAKLNTLKLPKLGTFTGFPTGPGMPEVE